MPFPTKPCFAYHPKGWDDAVLQHPAMAFMHRFTHEWCETKAAHSQPFSDWYAPGYELGSHDGRRFTGDMAAKAFVKSVELYSSSTVEISACYLEETEDGYTGVATGMIYANFVVPGEKTCKDSQGREWELCVPRAYDCTFVRDASGPINGLKLSKMAVYGDLQPVLQAAAKRNLTA